MVAFFLSCQNQKISCPRVGRINQISRPSKLPRLDRRRGEQEMPFFFNFLEDKKRGEGEHTRESPKKGIRMVPFEVNLAGCR